MMMKVLMDNILRTIKTQSWWVMVVLVTVMVMEVTSLNGPNVCMVKQKYNITKRVKYRAPMSVRTYEWCFAMPPRCSRWNTEMRDLTRLETEERTAEMAVCCPGYKMKDVSCFPICPNGRTGHGCSEDCATNKWGPNCAHDCKKCKHGSCSPTTGECQCQEGWQGESCEISMTTNSAVMMEQLLTTSKSITSSTKPTTLPTTIHEASSRLVETSLATAPVTSTDISTGTKKSTQTSLTSMKTVDEILIFTTQKPTVISASENTVTYDNGTLANLMTTYATATEAVTKKFMNNNSIYNRIYIPEEHSEERDPIIKPSSTAESASNNIHREDSPTTIAPKSTTALTITTEPITPSTTLKETTVKLETTRASETTRKLETTVKQMTTVKFKPKEIWIRPTQKGEYPLIDLKAKPGHELPHLKYKNATKKEVTDNTTPKTIIVSIIPTSVSYATFKKIALTTLASHVSQRYNITLKSYNRTMDYGYTKPMTIQTSTVNPFTIKFFNTIPRIANTSSSANPILHVTRTKAYTITDKIVMIPNKTNSMSSTSNSINRKLNYTTLLTTVSTNVQGNTRGQNHSEVSTTRYLTTSFKSMITLTSRNVTTEHPSINKQSVTLIQRNTTTKPVTDSPKVTKTLVRKQADSTSKKNLTTNAQTNTVTEDPIKDEETFHILTEPEHITAVMGDKGTERASVDLISVISIAGGVMMAVITVAVVIVMLERCKRPRYEDVRKFNDIRMQVMIDNNDVPPPYVRSIFHTPLPDPPTSDKCHYQPISTLDRNLKQFMRPVVVQTISPIMLENFRGILECHYDHLPRRSHDLGTMQMRCSMAPSIEECRELLHPRECLLTDSAIEAMKCEAKLDVIDNTTSEPLYAEIPCWRPPSEHAIEIMNLNGEAVTEL